VLGTRAQLEMRGSPCLHPRRKCTEASCLGSCERSLGSDAAPQHSRCQRNWNPKGGRIRSVARGRSQNAVPATGGKKIFTPALNKAPTDRQMIVTRERSV
jgi:hypothetical protein